MEYPKDNVIKGVSCIAILTYKYSIVTGSGSDTN